MTLNEIWNEWSRRFQVWGKLNGTWKHIVALDGEQAIIDDWQLPSEIGRARRIVDVKEFTEFDLSN